MKGIVGWATGAVGALLLALMLVPRPPEATPDNIPAAPPRLRLRLGTVSRSPGEETAHYRAFGEFLAGRLAGLGFGGAETVLADSLEGMAEHLRHQQVDLYFDSALSAATVCLTAPARPMLRRWKGGRAEDGSVVFARRDRGITSLEQLRGRRVAFSEPHSTSAYLLPLAALLDHGLDPCRRTLAESLAPGETGYEFSGDDETSLIWVIRGRVDAAALGLAAFGELKGRDGGFMIIARTPLMPRHVVVHRSGLAPPAAQAIARTLGSLHLDERGREALAAFEATTRFDPFPGPPGEYFEPILRLADRLRHLRER
jgi:phosphonate transport system substrate-binding protein